MNNFHVSRSIILSSPTAFADPVMVDNKVSSCRLLTSLVLALHPMTHKQRYVYLAIMYSIYGGVAEYP
ncbi:hypothetical protein, partial [Acidithiobacillus thiooxidans]|uniref:hypothetical protein n=1 Tax=Acidithiobacillus thiooxidans TaxID=930 RepID=UPI001C07E6F5